MELSLPRPTTAPHLHLHWCWVINNFNCSPDINLKLQKKFKIIKLIQKITKILPETIHHVYYLYKKFWSENLIRSSLWLKILSNPSHVYGTSSEMLSFVSNVCDNFYETCSIFYHSLHVWYHDILTNLIIFRLRLIFIEFKTYLACTFVVMFREQDVRIFLSILQQCLKLDSITWISFFHSLYSIIRITCSSNLSNSKKIILLK